LSAPCWSTVLPVAAALFERLRSFSARVMLAAQSIEGLHDDPGERDRLLNAASALIAHRLADPDPIVTRAGTIRRPERSHQLDATGATAMGSLRLQDTYRVDPNDLRSLPAGVAYVVTGGRAAKVAISRGGQAPRGLPPARPKGPGGCQAGGPGAFTPPSRLSGDRGSRATRRRRFWGCWLGRG